MDNDDDIFDGDEISPSHRAQQQRDYEREYREWYESCTPHERSYLHKVGLDKPDGDIQQINGKRRSVEEMDLPEDVAAKPSSVAEQTLLTRVLIEVANSGNVPLYLDAWLWALRVYEYSNETNESLAKRHGVSKQRFNAIVQLIVDGYDLPPPNNGRDLRKRTLESLARCQKPSLPSVSQRKSASYTTESPKPRKMYSLTPSRSAAS